MPGCRRPNLLRGFEPFVGVRRRHLDVGQHELGAARVDEAQQRGRVARPAHDLEAGVGEQAGESFAQEHLVFGEDYAHGSSRRRCAAPSALRLTFTCPSTAPTRSSTSVAVSDAVIDAQAEHQPTVRTVPLMSRRPAGPCDRRPHRSRQRTPSAPSTGALGRRADVDPRGPTRRARRWRRRALHPQHRGKDAVCERAELVQRRANLIAARPRAGAASAALAAAPAAIASRTSPCCAPSWTLRSRRRRSPSAAAAIRRTRLAQPNELSAVIGLEALVLDRQPRGALNLADKTRVVEQVGRCSTTAANRAVARQRRRPGSPAARKAGTGRPPESIQPPPCAG